MKRMSYYGHRNAIYRKLPYYRKLRGMTQWMLAAKMQLLNVNIDQHTISNIECDRRCVTDYELACLCKILRVTGEDLTADYYVEYEGEY